MKKQEYLDKLELEMRRLNVAQLHEVLADYREHFDMGLSKGKTEEEIAGKLGDPSVVAKAYQAENLISRIQDAPMQDQVGHFIKAFLRILVLTPFNFFMMVGPFLIMGCLLFAGWTITLSTGGAGIAVALALAVAVPMSAVGFFGGAALLFGSLSVVGVSLMGFMFMFFITQIVLGLFIKYLKWNVEFVKGDTK